jgi:hypothetical protein
MRILILSDPMNTKFEVEIKFGGKIKDARR